MSRYTPPRNRRSGRLPAVAASVAFSAAMLPTVAMAEPTTVVAVVPATVYSSIESCTASLTPAVFGPADTVTLTTSFSGTVGAFLAVGADNLGADYVSLYPPTPLDDVLALPVPEFALMFGLAPGSHTMDMYAVTADGLAVGEPLCSVSYDFGPSVFEFTGGMELPRGVVGKPYWTSTGSMAWGPSAPGWNPRRGSCDLELVSFTPHGNGGNGGNGGAGGAGGDGGVGGNGGAGGNGGNGGNGGLLGGSYGGGIQLTTFGGPSGGAGGYGPTAMGPSGAGGNGGAGGAESGGVLKKTVLVGMEHEPGDPETDCGTFFGTPMEAGTYTLRQVGTFVCPATVEPKSGLSPSDVASQTYAISRLLTWVVDPAVTPTFTG